MSFFAKEKIVDRLLNDAIYSIPRNQRRYVWKEQNWSDLFDDLTLVIDGISTSHFIGSIVLEDEGKDSIDGLSRYTVIDGQQRILTLTIFIAAIMFAFKQRNMLDDFGGTKKYLVARTIKNQDRLIVDPEYHLTLREMIRKILSKEPEELRSYSVNTFCNDCIVSSPKDKQIIEAFKFFYGKLSPFSDERLLALRDAIIGISYVNITSSTDEDSYTIFEILNARGLDLQDHELLKNYIMRYLQPVERRDEAKRYWEEIEADLGKSIDEFLRHYAVHKYGYSTKKDAGSVYKTIQNKTKGRNIETLLDDVKRKSRYYQRIVSPSEEMCATKVEFDILSFFKSKRVAVFRPLILSLMHLLEMEKISTNRYDSFLKFLYHFFVCYKIIGQENSNALTDPILKYAYSMEDKFSDNLLSECVQRMKDRLPPIDSFTNSFKNIGYSHHWPLYQDSKSKDRCTLVLTALEEYISGRKLNVERLTIEHILPDSQSIENAQIGNLFFLEASLNRRCADKEMPQKMDIYKDSKLECPRSFVKRYEDVEFDPYKRTCYLAQLFYYQILSIPQQGDDL